MSIDLPSLTTIILNDNAWRGECSNSGLNYEPYNYVNSLRIHSTNESMFSDLDVASLQLIYGSSTLDCIGYVELYSN